MGTFINPTLQFLILLSTPILGFFINFLFCKQHRQIGAGIASFSIWIGFIQIAIGWVLKGPIDQNKPLMGFFANDLTWVVATLILFVSSIVHHFSQRYMSGDRNYRRYFLLLNLITITILLMAAADNIIIFTLCWLFTNLLLVMLIIHKLEWTPAKNSGLLAMKTFIIGFICLSAGTGLLAYGAESLSIAFIVKHQNTLPGILRPAALCLIIIAACSQSGSWPFHRWLISSVNAPTPVSAFMHAGLINGGGLLLIRFSFLFSNEPVLLQILVVLSTITLTLGGIWKLMQTDIKRMLACSTMTQMGFMMMQCGLGLFPAALTHLCWHGLFKAFLFLKSGSTIAEGINTKQSAISHPLKFCLSSLCGLLGALGFILAIDFDFPIADTRMILIFFAWITSTQLAHTAIEKQNWLSRFFASTILCLFSGIIYGLTIHLIETKLTSIHIFHPQQLTPVHMILMLFIFCIWIEFNFNLLNKWKKHALWNQLYVKNLNASQPAPNTKSSIRDRT